MLAPSTRIPRRLLLMCMAVNQRGQGAVKGALIIASQYPSQRVP